MENPQLNNRAICSEKKSQKLKPKIMYEVTLETIDFMPLLKQQLIIFKGIHYGEDADYSNHSLVQEYHYLNRNNLLSELHKTECMDSPLRLEFNYGV